MSTTDATAVANGTVVDGTATPEPKSAPVATAQRIETLDILRGFAVLGILAVNAIAFAWPITLEPAGASAPYHVEGANQFAVWLVEAILHNKCRTLFSMLFGVSIYLVGGERADKARGALLRRRLFFLAIFGLIHGLAFWFGDILLLYAWSGLFMMLARSWPASKLFKVGTGLIAGMSLLEIGVPTVFRILNPYDPVKAAEETAKAHKGLLATIETVQSGWAGAMIENAKGWLLVQGGSLIVYVFGTVGLMMVGLGLFKTGYMTGRASDRRYGFAVAVGAVITIAFGVSHWLVLDPGPASISLHLIDSVLDNLAPFVTLAYVGLLVLMTRHGLGFVTRRLAPVGRMAFTNYLTQTLIMSSLFYMPWGPKLYGQVEPAPLWGIVAAIWVLQLIWSPLWLSRFEMGPLEWVWRCLTYGRRVPLVKRA